VIIREAARLLASSPVGDISTRAVCEAAGVTQPVLYRTFGDKDGLLAAVVDAVWDEYLSGKRAAEISDDPLVDLYAGWESHVTFALAHPHAYRLLFGTDLAQRADASAEALSLVRANLERLASHGRLNRDPAEAARIVMAANTGVSLALLLRANEYPDRSISDQVRSSVYRSLLTDAESNHGNDVEPGSSAAAVAAITLIASLDAGAFDTTFTSAESALFTEWLERIRAGQPKTIR